MSTVLALLTTLRGSAAGEGPLRLRRSWPRGEGRLLLEYVDGRGTAVAGQWHDDARLGEAVARTTPGATWLAHPGVVLQPAGADRRLPVIARLLAEPGASLVVHRPERRAVIRRPGATYTKVVRPSKAAAVLASDRAARGTGAILPELLGVDLEAGTLEWAELPGRALDDLLLDAAVPLPELARAGASTGRALRSLHSSAPSAGIAYHDAAAEVEVVTGWRKAALAFASGPPGLDRVIDEAAALLAEPPSAPVLVHRDLHEKQVLIDGDRTGLLDLDTLADGEAAIDLANLLVHLELRVALGPTPERSQAVAAAFLDAYGPSPDVVARIPGYAAATRARLACVYAFRPAEAAAAAALLAHPAAARTRQG